MWHFDLYSELVRTPMGILKAAAPQGGIILYGRVNNRLSEIPNGLAKYAEHITQSHLAFYIFDIFASQWGLAPNQTAAASDGRVLLLLPDTQPEYEIAVFNTRLTYLRQSQIGPSREANLVVGCFWVHQDKGYTLEPAKVVTADMMNIEPKDIEIFKTNLISPDAMISAQPPFPKRLGTDCPLLTGDVNPLPAFYDVTPAGAFVQVKSLRQFMMCLKDRHLAETRPSWGISAELSKSIGCSRYDLGTQTKQIRNPNEITEMLIAELPKAEKKFDTIRQEYLSSTYDNFRGSFKSYLDKIKAYLQEGNTSGDYSRSGRARVRALLNSIVSNTDTETRGAEDEVNAILDELSPDETLKVLFSERLDPESGNSLVQLLVKYEAITNIRARVLLGFLWSVLKLKSNFSELINRAKSDTQIAWYILKNPYALTYISPNISISDLDTLACFVGKANNPQTVLPLRAIAYMHGVLSTHESKSIIFEQKRLTIEAGYKLTKSQYETYTQTGSLLDATQRLLARQFDESVDCSLIPSRNITQTYDGAIIRLDIDSRWVLQQYIDSGLGLSVNYHDRDYLMDYSQAKQFCYIISRVCEDNKNFKTDEVDYTPYIEAFAANKGYELETEQKNATQLLQFGCSCLTGPAGSGKTTVLELLIYCKKQAEGITDDEIVLVAPTGMAAKRITECTGYSARTIHSQFNIISENVDLDYDKKPDSSFRPKLVIFDEASMIALPLLYQALHKIPEGTQIIFAGDIEQLPPINTGKPFADLLTILPYERLLVSKRAKAGSAITSNCNALLSNNLNNLQNGRDVKLVSALENNQFPDLIAHICRYYVEPVSGIAPLPDMLTPEGTITPDDIQVVTPVAKASYSWGATALNTALRDVFNPKTHFQNKVCFRDASYNNTELREGDRVINSINSRVIPRYIFGEDKDTLINSGRGILNGNIGIIRAIRPSSEYNFLKYNQDGDLTPDIEALKLANTSKAGIKIYVLVEYTDIDNSKYLVAYHCYAEGNSGSFVIPSTELRSLQLAYAVTVHKMQGSQAKIVIAPLFKCKARDFISKNLVYTAWSRATKALYVIGDVSTYKTSALGTASQVNNLTTRLSPCDIT